MKDRSLVGLLFGFENNQIMNYLVGRQTNVFRENIGLIRNNFLITSTRDGLN